MFIVVMTVFVIVGIAAIALAQPRPPEIHVWNDETERKLSRAHANHHGLW